MYVGAGTRGPFAFRDGLVDVPFASATHVKVTRINALDIPTVLVEGVHYDLATTLDAENALYTGSVSLRVSQPVLASTEKLLIERLQGLDQALALQFNQKFPSASFTQLQDRVMSILQEMRLKLDRALLVSGWKSGVVAPGPIQGKGRVFGLDPVTGEAALLTIDDASDTAQLIAEVTFTGDGSATLFTLPNQRVPAEASLLITIGGSIQPTSEYALTYVDPDTRITFDDAPADGAQIIVRMLGYAAPQADEALAAADAAAASAASASASAVQAAADRVQTGADRALAQTAATAAGASAIAAAASAAAIAIDEAAMQDFVDAAEAAAAAAAADAALLDSPDYGFIADVVSDTADLGSIA